MDKLVALIVRVVSALAGGAWLIPGITYAQRKPGEPVKVLLAGYNGARNTGSDVRVAALAQQLRKLMGANVKVSVMTMDAASTAPYFESGERQIEFSTVFFGDLLKACSEHHVAILCEGSTFKSKFANALTLYSCEAAGVMRAQGKPCIAFGSEVGAMEPYLERAVRALCTDVRFVVRSAGSLDALRGLGFDGILGTDTAWTFDSSKGRSKALELLHAGGWDGRKPLLGIAPVNPFCWPVRPSLRKLAQSALTGDRSLKYKSWYFFSWSEERERKFHAYINAIAQACATFMRERGFFPVIFGMEQLDAQACHLLADRLEELTGQRAPLLLSNDNDGYVMAEALRSLSLLATSRYHAQVLSMAALVPTVAVSMDERLDNLAEEIDADPQLLLEVESPDLAPRLLLALDYAHDNDSDIRAHLAESVREAKSKLAEMDSWLMRQLMPQKSAPLGSGQMAHL